MRRASVGVIGLVVLRNPLFVPAGATPWPAWDENAADSAHDLGALCREAELRIRAAKPRCRETTRESSFKLHIAGILSTRCGQCHIQASRGEFSMASFASLLAKPQAVTAGRPEASNLYVAVADGEMPPRGSVPSAELAAIRRWIEEGAQFDGTDKEAHLSSYTSANDGTDENRGFGGNRFGGLRGGFGFGGGGGPGGSPRLQMSDSTGSRRTDRRL